MHKGGFDSNKSRTSEAYAPAQHSSSEWEELKLHCTAAWERCQETGARTSAVEGALHCNPRCQGSITHFGVGSWATASRSGLTRWRGVLTYVTSLNSVWALFNNLSLLPKIKCLSLERYKNHQNTSHENPRIQLHFPPCSPKASLVHTMRPPPLLGSSLPRPSARLLLSGTMLTPPGCSPVLRGLPRILHSAVQTCLGLFQLFSPKIFSPTTPCIIWTFVLLRYRFSIRIYASLLSALCLKHNDSCYMVLCPKRLIFFNDNSLNPYHPRLQRFTCNIQRSPMMKK